MLACCLLRSGQIFFDALAARAWIWSDSFGWIRGSAWIPGIFVALPEAACLDSCHFLLPSLICLVLMGLALDSAGLGYFTGLAIVLGWSQFYMLLFRINRSITLG